VELDFLLQNILFKKEQNVALLGKTKEPHPKLENTIDSAAEKLNNISTK